MLQRLKNIYDSIPKRYVKFLKYIPNRLLFGKSYFTSKENISFDENVIDSKLSEMLNYARDNTQFGKEYIPSFVSPAIAKEVLESLPLISSSDLSDNLDYYISKEYKGLNSYLTTTGGTGRNPTSILLSNESFGIEWAHMHKVWSFADYNRISDLKLTLRGKSIVGERLVEYNPVYNELIVDTFKINSENIKELVSELIKYDIKYIHGYPSLLKEFIEYFKLAKFKPKLKGVLLGSEGASEIDKRNISEYFGCQVVHWYGQSEKVALAVDVNSDGLYKVFTSYGYPRIVNGELVATTFVNKALPLINYRTGDGAEIVKKDGNIFIKNLKGRWGKDFIYLTNNKKIPASSINLHSCIQDEISFYQIYQDKYAEIEVKVLQKTTSEMDSIKLLEIFSSEIKAKLQDFNVCVRLVNEDEIVRSHRGKMILIVQKLGRA